MKELHLIFICLLGLAVSDNSTIGDHSIIEDVSEISNAGNNLETDGVDQGIAWGEWSPWSKWSPCTRSCGGGISRQQRRCKRKLCKGRSWSTKYKICNAKPCEKPSDFRAEQCAAFDDVPYSGQLLKWYPHYDPSRPCSLICRVEQSTESGVSRLRQESTPEKTLPGDSDDDGMRYDSDEAIVVQLADKVEDGTRCYPNVDDLDVCIGGECMKVGCDLRVGSNKHTDACGICGGNGSSCQSRYAWNLESISACSKSCGGGFKVAMAVCKAVGLDETVVDESYCDPDGRPEKTLVPCNTHPCTTKWVTGEWSKCSASCGGGTRSRAVFCTEENGNETTKLPEHKCSGTHKPRYEETCNTISCPMWETNQWSECSVTCGTGIRRRTMECRDANGRISDDCDSSERPHSEQECKTNVACSIYDDDLTQPLMQPYPPPPIPEKLLDQPIPSESTYIAEQWSPCSVSCGEGIRRREVHCKIYLEFSHTIAKLTDEQCLGQTKPIETEKCVMEPCGLLENSLSYRIGTVGDSGYAESSLTDSYRSQSGGPSGSGYDGGIKVAPGGDVQTTYSWKEAGYTPCTASCLGGVQDLIINCVRDDTGKTVMPLLCTTETKPEARIRTCNDHPCPPRWNYSEFSTCMSPCGIGIQTRDVTCIHEVTRGKSNTVAVPNHMCPQPPPADRRYCNVWDCPVTWNTGDWGKCSKTCGGGLKKRKVTCEQIMAQGHRQNREDRDCPPQKPSSEKPCNTRACHELDAGAQPIILSQNSTYNQTDLNTKIDLKIGGIARVFQGTPFIKIRCPVKKFDKAQIAWMKDHKELRKSRKYKISRKGALKIVDIVTSDTGIYACIAGHSHAETHLIVKFRSKEQISSEEYLRLGNSVYLQRNVNLDSAPAGSGESLYTDHAAAYGNRYVPIDSEDISHEHAAPSSKPTRKPHQKKQKTSPTPPESTVMHKEHTVTSLNQPGYHESAESAATSSASRLVPHLTYLISSFKEYWPFQSDTTSGRSHRTAPVSFIDNVRKEIVATRHTEPSRQTGLRYQNLEENLERLYRNTAIPDKTFGPDEERIFIDVDPYDLDESLFGLQHSDITYSTRDVPEEKNLASSAKPDVDYVEESLKNVKRQWQEKQSDSLRNQRGAKNQGQDEEADFPAISDDLGLDVYYVQDTTASEKVQTHEATFPSVNTRHRDTENKDSSNTLSTMSLRSTEEISNTREKEIWESDNKTDDFNGEEFKKRNSETHTITSTTEHGDIQNLFTKDSDDDFIRSTLPDESITTTNIISNDDTKSLTPMNDHENTDDMTNLTTKKEEKIFSTTTNMSDIVTEATIGSTPMIGGPDELVFEWVTTKWFKCSQTCGGSGFQMRGAQCTVRPANSSGMSQRTVVGATLCENAGHPAPQKVRSCGFGKCPQWHTTEWTHCETSRCFNWKTAMQRRDVTCRLTGDSENGGENVTIVDASKCDDSTRPLQRQECYNDACKGVWRVGDWSECTASCEEDGIKYRILQCVWFGTKKPAGNACRDTPRPAVMKTCRGPPCPQATEECKDHSQRCSRVKMMNLCRVPVYRRQCCESCR